MFILHGVFYEGLMMMAIKTYLVEEVSMPDGSYQIKVIGIGGHSTTVFSADTMLEANSLFESAGFRK